MVFMEGKVWENRPRWFGYVLRRDGSEVVKIAIKMDIEGRRRSDQKRKCYMWLKVI